MLDNQIPLRQSQASQAREQEKPPALRPTVLRPFRNRWTVRSLSTARVAPSAASKSITFLERPKIALPPKQPDSATKRQVVHDASKVTATPQGRNAGVCHYHAPGTTAP